MEDFLLKLRVLWTVGFYLFLFLFLLWFLIPIYKKILSKIRSIVKNIKIKQTDSVKEVSSRDLRKQDWGILAIALGIVIQSIDKLQIAKKFINEIQTFAWGGFIFVFIMIIISKRN